MQNNWWPASGHRYGNPVALNGIGYYGWYWSASGYPSTVYQAYLLYFNYNGGMNPNSYLNRSHCYAIRCIAE